MKTKILLVDDEEDILIGLSEELSTQGHEVLTASNGKDAIEILKETPVDFLVTDIRMPDMNGVDLLLRAKELNPEMKVVVMTAYGSEDTKEEILDKGAISYLEKPFDFEQLLSIIEEKTTLEDTLSQWNLAEVLQLITMEGKSAILEVESKAGIGNIYIKDGDVIHAESGGLEGEEALHSILKEEDISFKVAWKTPKVDRTIDKSLYAILLESVATDKMVSPEEALKDFAKIIKEEEELAKTEGIDISGIEVPIEDTEEEAPEEIPTVPPEEKPEEKASEIKEVPGLAETEEPTKAEKEEQPIEEVKPPPEEAKAPKKEEEIEETKPSEEEKTKEEISVEPGIKEILADISTDLGEVICSMIISASGEIIARFGKETHLKSLEDISKDFIEKLKEFEGIINKSSVGKLEELFFVGSSFSLLLVSLKKSKGYAVLLLPQKTTKLGLARIKLSQLKKI